jgi:hypothetical protein
MSEGLDSLPQMTNAEQRDNDSLTVYFTRQPNAVQFGEVSSLANAL